MNVTLGAARITRISSGMRMWTNRRTSRPVRVGSVHEAESDDRQDRLDAVLPRDLLPLFVAAPVVRHAHFVNPQPRAELGDLGGDLRLKAKAIALQRRDAIQNILREDLV